MKKILKKLRFQFVDGGISAEDYNRIQSSLRQTNRNTWIVAAPLIVIFFAVVYVVTFSLKSFPLNHELYCAMMIAFLLITVMLRYRIKKDSPFLSCTFYAFNCFLMLFAIMLGGIAAGNYPAVTYMVLMVVLPLMTLDKPWRMNLLSTVFAVIFALVDLRYKTKDVIFIDHFNLVCFWALSVLINTQNVRDRFQGFLWQVTIEEDSARDGLTHVKNNASYSRLKVSVEQKIQEGTVEPFALAVCDINSLKRVNDTLGHEAGDTYLLKNCRNICRIFHHSPVYRIGGDEFLVYLTGMDYEQREMLLQMARKSSRNPSYRMPLQEQINFAIGMAEYQAGSGEHFTEVFRRADQSMYEDKKLLHNREQTGNPAAADRQPEDSLWEKLRDSRSGCILIIDHNELSREMMRVFLEDQYCIFCADNGKEGLQVLQKEYRDISLILLELMLPEMNGYEFLKKIRKDPVFSNIPVIVVTDSCSPEAEDRCLQLGANDFAVKPYHPGILLQRIRNLIRYTESTAALSAVEYDELTGLYTRQAFYHHAGILLRQNPTTRYDLCVSDIDNFKAINAFYGETTGDQILRNTGAYLKEGTKKGILAGRYGNDQFVCLIPHTDEMSKEIVSDTFDQLISKNPLPGIHIEPKMGIYDDVDHSLPVSILCDRAISALKTVKHQYGKLYGVYDATIQEEESRRQQIEQDMLTAYQEDQFQVYYQPKIDSRTGELAGAEALIRWKHPRMGMMPPGSFIPLFEQNGFISYADFYVWKRTCKNLRGWMDAGLQVVPISVNASRRDFEWKNYLDRILEPLEKYQLDPSYLHIEVTESIFTANMDDILRELKKCREKGFKIELDDFGTGYSSLNTLGTLPLDVLKLDGSFIKQIQDDRKARVLRYSIDLARSLGLETIAEGAETEEQVRILQELGCDRIQGYYYSKPLSEEEFTWYLQNNKRDSSES